MITVRPYSTYDETRLMIRDHDRAMNIKTLVNEHILANSTAWTLSVHGEEAAIVGAYPMYPGVIQVWAITTELIKGHGLEYTRLCKRLLDDYVISNQVRRIAGAVQGDIEINRKWVELLGFRMEAVMEEAAPNGEDIVCYVKFNRGSHEPLTGRV